VIILLMGHRQTGELITSSLSCLHMTGRQYGSIEWSVYKLSLQIILTNMSLNVDEIEIYFFNTIRQKIT
jgi:hypothetical protein